MVYDKNLDETVWSEDVQISDQYNKGTKFKFVVSVMKYNGGQPKIDLKRLSYGAFQKGEYGKLGRITLSEMESLLPVIEEAMENMR